MNNEGDHALKDRGKWCSLEHGAWFIASGVLLIITAFLLGVICFSVRTLTTSLDQTVPNYATAFLVSTVPTDGEGVASEMLNVLRREMSQH